MSKEVDRCISRRYDIVQKLGRGAYGIVWRGRDRKKNRDVAVKKCFGAFDNSTDAQRTYREIMFLQQLDHDNIIKIINVHPADNEKVNWIHCVVAAAVVVVCRICHVVVVVFRIYI